MQQGLLSNPGLSCINKKKKRVGKNLHEYRGVLREYHAFGRRQKGQRENRGLPEKLQEQHS